MFFMEIYWLFNEISSSWRILNVNRYGWIVQDWVRHSRTQKGWEMENVSHFSLAPQLAFGSSESPFSSMLMLFQWIDVRSQTESSQSWCNARCTNTAHEEFPLRLMVNICKRSFLRMCFILPSVEHPLASQQTTWMWNHHTTVYVKFAIPDDDGNDSQWPRTQAV